ncbi:PD-(D/E)XK nuclease-like domain-containing protein [Paramicrobacterium agarici]|uniref:PD-(D/E)XK nuclease-like domain-containing protein n=1 Tax=Paramicrobacterium agarici TaxID=630514 RepID=UPI00116B303E|nr:PD-(D/E)XK nuclease-like domain-containing protein [Microbacterium agarici]TQO23823.1 PDDEXK-like uncharacterized protein DUF3799 [Microbacterium agarici]
MTEGIVLDMPEREYHAHPALSSTQARQILDSPAKYHYAQTHPQEARHEFDLGTAVHTKVLGTGSDVEVLNFDNYRTKAAQQARDEARACGLVPMLAVDMEPVNDMAEAVLSHPLAKTLFEQEGNPEASVFATDPETGVEVRARFDFLGKIAVDLKTTAGEASPHGFAKSAASYRYNVQQEHYLFAHNIVQGEAPPMVFVVVEKAAPYLVGVHQLDRDFSDMGKVQARKARERFAECTASGVWPGYPEEVNLVIPPMWAVYEHQERFEN